MDDISKIYSQWSLMDKLSKLAYLSKEMQALDKIASQLSASYNRKGYFTSTEKICVNNILEMYNFYQDNQMKLNRELKNECLKELMKNMMK